MESWNVRFGRSVVLLVILTALVGCSPRATNTAAAPTANISPSSVPTPVAPPPTVTPPSPTTTPLLPYAGQPVIRPDAENSRPTSAPLVSVAASKTGYVVNPSTGPVLNMGFRWANDELLIVEQQSPAGGQIVDLREKEIVVPGTDQNAYQLVQGFSADGKRVAITRGSQLVVQDMQSGQERSWTVAVLSDEVHTIGTDFISWSPDGRYLLGSWYPLFWKDTGYLSGKLWVLDYESGDLRSITTTGNRPNMEPVWSPIGDQAVVMQILGGYKGGGYPYDYLLIDMKSLSSQVILSCPAGGLQYDFRWDTAGKVEPLAQLPGPGKTRIMGYDPYRQLYENMAGEDSLSAYTQLHFLFPDGQIKERIDLGPAFQEQGIFIDENHLVWYSRVLTPDSKYLLMEGQVAKRDAMMQSTGFTCVISMDTLIPRLSVYSGSKSDHFIDASHGWHNNTVLVASENGLAMVDLVTLKQTTLLRDGHICVARWQDDHVVYATMREVGIVHPAGERQVLLTAADDEEFGGAQFSPSTKYLAVQRRRAGNGSGVVLALEIVAIK